MLHLLCIISKYVGYYFLRLSWHNWNDCELYNISWNLNILKRKKTESPNLFEYFSQITNLRHIFHNKWHYYNLVTEIEKSFSFNCAVKVSSKSSSILNCGSRWCDIKFYWKNKMKKLLYFPHIIFHFQPPFPEFS